MKPLFSVIVPIYNAEKFLSLPWEKRKQMGLNARTKVEKEFDRNLVVKAYLEELGQAYA